MFNTTNVESFLNAEPAQRAREGMELSLMCATHLCTVALLLQRQDQGLNPRELQDVGQLIREIATLGVAEHLLPREQIAPPANLHAGQNRARKRA